MQAEPTIADVLDEVRRLRDRQPLDHGRMWTYSDVGRYIGSKDAETARRYLQRQGAPRARQPTDAKGRKSQPLFLPAEIVAWWSKISQAA